MRRSIIVFAALISAVLCQAQTLLPVKVYFDNFNVEINKGDTIATEPFKGFQVSFPYTEELKEFDAFKVTFYANNYHPGTCTLKENVQITIGGEKYVKVEAVNEKIFKAKYLKNDTVYIDIIPESIYDSQNPFLRGFYDSFYVVVEAGYKSGDFEKKSYNADGSVYSTYTVNLFDGYSKIGKSVVFQNGIESHVLGFGGREKPHIPCAIEYYKNLNK